MNTQRRRFVSFFYLLLVVSCNTLSQQPENFRTEVMTIQNPTPSSPSGVSLILTSTELPPKDTITSPSSPKYLEPPLIAFLEIGDDFINLFSLNNYSSRLIDPPEFSSYILLRWSNRGCEMIVFPIFETSNILYRIDLAGNILEEFFNLDEYEKTGDHVFGISVSPGEDLIAFLIYRDSLNIDGVTPKDLYVTDRTGLNKLVRISEQGGAGEAAWSHDGSLLAYYDKDNDGYIQVYITKPDGSDRIQLTQNVNPKIEIREIIWSPDSSRLVVAYQIIEIDSIISQPLWVFNKNGEKIVTSTVEEIPYVEEIWWQDNSTVVLYLDLVPSSYSFENDEIVWINIYTGAIINRFGTSNISGEAFWTPRPIGNTSLFGMFTKNGFVTYDLLTNQVDDFSHADIRSANWLSAPFDFPGEEECEK